VHYFPALDESGFAGILEVWQAAFPRLAVLALLPEAEKDNVPLLQKFFSSRGISLMGGIFPELVVQGRFHKEGCWLLRFDEAPYYLLQEKLPHGREGAERVAAEVCGQLRPRLEGDGEATLFMLFDALVPNIASMLDEVYLKLADRVHYAGANAGSETFRPMPCLFDNTRTVSDAVLAILIKSHHGAILEHGYQLPEYCHSATSIEGNRIASISWRPAFEMYCELVRTQYGVEITRDNFYQYAVHFPFGIVRANHNVLVRIPVALGADGSLFCVGEVPPHSVLTLLEAPAVNSRHTVDALVERLARLNGGVAGRDLLLFYCAGRRMHLGVGAAEDEVQDMERRSGARQVAGALSLGEIGASTLWGYPLFHNATLVTALW
jgi:hypothetical protein